MLLSSELVDPPKLVYHSEVLLRLFPPLDLSPGKAIEVERNTALLNREPDFLLGTSGGGVLDSY